MCSWSHRIWGTELLSAELGFSRQASRLNQERKSVVRTEGCLPTAALLARDLGETRDYAAFGRRPGRNTDTAY